MLRPERAHECIELVGTLLERLVSFALEYDELGEDYFTGRNETQQRVNRLVAELRRIGQTVHLEPAA